MLLLGLGGGREAIFFSKSGFKVTGVDFVKEMVDRATDNARQRNIQIHGVVQEISKLDFPPCCFDVVWYSSSIYSATPGRKARIETLRRVGEMIAPNGYIACLFYWSPAFGQHGLKWAAGKFISWILLGNFKCEKGDFMKNNLEFLHAFSSKDEVSAEFAEAGLEAVTFVFPKDSNHAGAVLRKKGS